MSEKRENSSVQIGFEGNEAFDSAGPSRTVGMENVPGLEKVNLEMGEPVQVQVEENVDLLDETKPTCMEKTLGLLEKYCFWLNITWIHALIFIILFYVMNVIFFFALSKDGRGSFANNSFTKLLALSSARSVWFLIFSLVAVGLGRLLQMYQNLLLGTNKLMWYYSSALRTYKPDDEFWAEHRQLLIQKWNDWILLAWLLTIRVISTPLRLKFPSLQAIKAKGLMTDVEYQSIFDEQKKKNLKAKDLPLVVFEWLILLNEKSAGDYKTLYQYKTILNSINLLSLASSSVTLKISQTISNLLIVFGNLGFYIFCFTSILGFNAASFTAVSTSAIITAFIYPLLYLIPIFVFCLWLNYLRKTMEPFGWNIDDIDVCKVFKRHSEKAKQYCENTGADYSLVVDQAVVV